jgi:serine/threonine protein kinase
VSTYVRERSGLHVVVQTGPPMNAGGEGKIYRLSPTECLKIYHKPLLTHEIEKIYYLCTVRHKIAGFAWPIEPVRELNSAATCGFIMSLVQGETLEDLIDQHHTIPLKKAIGLCIDIAHAVQAAHDFPQANLVLGDLIKGTNLIVSGTNATFIDTASVSLMNLRHRNGTVGSSINRYVTPGYTAPERIQDPKRPPDRSQDNFALATLFFEILFGVPPYKPKSSPATIGFDPNDYVLKKRFFHFVAVPGIGAPNYPKVTLPPDIDQLFRAALLSDIRPTAAHWLTALTAWGNAKRVVRQQPQPVHPIKPQPLGTQPISPVSPQQVQPVRPKPIPAIHPQPQIYHPQPALPPTALQQYSSTPLTPINVPKQRIRILIPTLGFVWNLIICIPKVLANLIRQLLALPKNTIEAIVIGVVDLADFFAKMYWKLFASFLAVILIFFTTSFTYRLIAVDLNLTNPKIPARSNTVTELVNQIFGPEGFIRVLKDWPDPLSNRSQTENTAPSYPPVPSKEVGPRIIDEVLE